MSFSEMVEAICERDSVPELLKTAVVQLLFKKENSQFFFKIVTQLP